MTITDERLAELRRIAQAATPGEWDCPPGPFDVFEDDHVLWIETDHDGGYPICAVDESRRSDAEHIAAFDPATTDALLAELQAARDMATMLNAVLGKIDIPTGMPGTDNVTIDLDAAVIHGLRWAVERYNAARNQEAGDE